MATNSIESAVPRCPNLVDSKISTKSDVTPLTSLEQRHDQMHVIAHKLSDKPQYEAISYKEKGRRYLLRLGITSSQPGPTFSRPHTISLSTLPPVYCGRLLFAYILIHTEGSTTESEWGRLVGSKVGISSCAVFGQVRFQLGGLLDIVSCIGDQ
jgi:hypothetical protein